MAIKCGSSGHTHDTVAEVRACQSAPTNYAKASGASAIRQEAVAARNFYNDAAERGTIRPEQAARYSRNVERSYADRTEELASDRQVGYIAVLLRERDWSARTDAEILAAFQAKLEDREYKAQLFTRKSASWLIAELEACDEKPQTAKAYRTEAERRVNGHSKSNPYERVNALLEQVPDGRYAVPLEDKTHFYVVKLAHPKAGFRWVKEQASDELFKMYPNQQEAALKAILEYGLEKAGLLYGERLGQCRNCGRGLTDDDNPYKPYGYGPECGPKKMGALPG